ncbi:hypothetical protein EV121DRAFT_174215, partial [Schizophyllum commune]
ETFALTMQFIVVVSALMVWGFLFVAAAPIIMLDDSLISANGRPAPRVVAGKSPQTKKDTFTPA